MIRTDLAAAFSLLTRLPVGWLFPAEAKVDQARAVWAYPLVGVVVGGIGAAVYAACHRLGLAPALAALWALAALILTTGGLHEDGLADSADGFGGGRTRARKLEIMKDSRIGSYGALALMLSLALRAGAVALIAEPQAVALALITAGALGRAAMLLPLRLLAPARTDGLGASVAGGPVPAAVLAAVAAIVLALAFHPLSRAAPMLACAALAGLAVSRLARLQIGGYTGDVLGASCVIAECLVLSLAA